VKNYLVLGILKLLAWVPLTYGRLKGSALGWLVYKANAGPVKVVRVNLRHCYPDMDEGERDSLCKKRMQHLGKAIFETPQVWRKGNPWVTEKITAIHGEHLFTQAINSPNRGTILIIPHQGNWEVLGLWAAQFKPMTSLYDPPRMAELEHWIKSSRQQSGATLVPTNVRGVAALVKALKRGDISGILPDQQPPASSGEFAHFMGLSARTMTLIHKLLQRSGAQALMATALRDESGWNLHFIAVDDEIYSDDQQLSLQALNRGVEAIVALAPEQYQWEYKRFRDQPEGQSSFYG